MILISHLFMKELIEKTTLGLGGVGDTKGLMESALRDKTNKWVRNVHEIT
jgi:hypothetical protein